MDFFSSLVLGCSNTIETMNVKLKVYFNSNSFESDLDEIINVLHKYAKSNADFSGISNFDSRLTAKKDFLKKQIGFALLAAAGTGVAKAIQEGRYEVIGEYVMITVGTTVIMLAITAAGLIIKRIVNGIEVSSSVVSA